MSRHAESDYTFLMRVGVLLGFFCLAIPAVALGADTSPHERYDALNALRVDPAATYQISIANRIELRRADVQLFFEEGRFAFFGALDGRITGAVFSGRGHVLAGLTVERPSLEDVYLELTSEGAPARAPERIMR